MDPIVLRSIERIVAVLIGGVSIYLGFRLFLAMPDRTDSEGKVLLPGGISIYLTRIGPGAFFALFGAVVVAISFRAAISYQEGAQQAITQRHSGGMGTSADKSLSQESVSVSKSFTGFGGGTEEDEFFARQQAARDIKFLNSQAMPILEGSGGRLKRGDVEPLMRRTKIAIVRSVWDPKWGDFVKFMKWVDAGATGPAPNEIASRLYTEGDI